MDYRLQSYLFNRSLVGLLCIGEILDAHRLGYAMPAHNGNLLDVFKEDIDDECDVRVVEARE